MNKNYIFGWVVIFLFVATVSLAEEGVTEKEILIGMSNALGGPASALGTGMKTGSAVYFNRVNAAGGVNGRKIRLVSYDDGYEPDRAIVNTIKLIEEEKVFILFGYVGTPTSSAVVPIFSKAAVPYIAPFTGAEILRNPVNKYLYNVRASYFDETEVMVDHLIKDLGIKKIGVFSQSDAYGDAGRAGVIRALRKHNLALTGDGRFQRNTVNIDDGLDALVKANPEAVIMIGTYKPCAVFIKTAKSRGFKPKFLNVSFVGTKVLIHALGNDGDGVFITQVVPNPADSTLPIVEQFRTDMKGAGHELDDFTSLEGYIGAAVLVEALKKTVPLNRAAFISTFEGLNVNIGGLKVFLSPANHQGLKDVFLTKIEKGKAVSITKLD